LLHAIDSLFDRQRYQLSKAAANLHTLSPLATLQRGYSITRRLENGAVIRDAAEVAAGERIETLLSQGRLICDVVSVSE
jgi:exodeoxyribonuclease VII large subunit